MASFGVQKLAFIVVLVLVVLTSHLQVQAAVTCSDVMRNLSPCISYVEGGALQSNCCSGIKELLAVAKTTGDRQNVCNCLKSAVQGINYSSNSLRLAKELPNKCGVRLPYEISPSTECNKVQ